MNPIIESWFWRVSWIYLFRNTSTLSLPAGMKRTPWYFPFSKAVSQVALPHALGLSTHGSDQPLVTHTSHWHKVWWQNFQMLYTLQHSKILSVFRDIYFYKNSWCKCKINLVNEHVKLKPNVSSLSKVKLAKQTIKLQRTIKHHFQSSKTQQ